MNIWMELQPVSDICHLTFVQMLGGSEMVHGGRTYPGNMEASFGMFASLGTRLSSADSVLVEVRFH